MVPFQQPLAVAVMLSDRAQAAMEHIAIHEYNLAGCEWGGVLWGNVLQLRRTRGLVPIISLATSGICHATPTSCDITAASWDRVRLRKEGINTSGLDVVGLWHSHPKMGIFTSGADQQSLWSFAHIPAWTSLIIDPWKAQRGAFSRTGEKTLGKITICDISDDDARTLEHHQRRWVNHVQSV
jgi:proteasome lid subunit RPN8/RPN11